MIDQKLLLMLNQIEKKPYKVRKQLKIKFKYKAQNATLEMQLTNKK